MTGNIIEAYGAHVRIRRAERADVDDVLVEVRKWWQGCSEQWEKAIEQTLRYLWPRFEDEAMDVGRVGAREGRFTGEDPIEWSFDEIHRSTTDLNL